MANDHADVVILGGGLVGCAAAYFLSKEGLKTVVVERDSVGSHASGFAYGGLSPLGGVGIPGPVLPLSVEGMRLHVSMAGELQQETGVDVQFHLKPTLTMVFSEEETEPLKTNFVWQQRQHGYKVQWLEGDEVRAIDPRISPKALGGVLTEGTAEVEPYRLVLSVAQAAERGGAVMRHGEVEGLRRSGARVTAVVLRSGDIACERVVLALGPWTGAASQWLGVPVPIEPLKGQILRLQAPGSPLECSFGWAGNYATTKPDGLLWAGTTEEEVGFDENPTTEARDRIMGALLTMIPSVEAAELVHHTACLRPVSSDGLPILGLVPGWEGVYLATGAGRKGILLGPIMGRIVADLIAKGQTDLPIEAFAPDRFSH